MKIGRNDPCHCSSGKKYKHCCLAKDQAATILDHDWQQLRNTERTVVHLLMSVALEWYGPGFIDKAWEEYTESSLEPLPMEEAIESETSFVPWALFNYIPQDQSDGEPPNEVPVAFEFLIVADELAPYEKQFALEACRQDHLLVCAGS